MNELITNKYFLIAVAVAVVILIIIVVVLTSSRKKKYELFLEKAKQFDVEKTRVINLPVNSELAKLELVIKDKDLLLRLEEWKNRWDAIHYKELKQCTNTILEYEDLVEKKKFRFAENSEVACKGAIQDLRIVTQELLDEIVELSKCEEENRALVTQLKIAFRDTKKKFSANEPLLLLVKTEIETEFIKLNNMLIDLERIISINNYDKTKEIVDVISNSLKKVDIMVDKLPDILLIVKQLIPRKIDYLEAVQLEAVQNNVYIGHLTLDSRLSEAKQMVDKCLEKIKQLDLIDIDSELEGVAKYLEELEEIVLYEIQSRKNAQESLDELTSLVKRSYYMIDDLGREYIKVQTLYEMNDFEEIDVTVYYDKYEVIKEKLTPYLELVPHEHSSYMQVNQELKMLLVEVNRFFEEISRQLDSILRMRADEQRAKEQIIEIKALVDEANKIVRDAKLPFIPDDFGILADDANYAIEQIIIELTNTPIDITTLNIRVDTALELAFKLYERTKIVVKEAKMVEAGVLYGNRYRSSYEFVDEGLAITEKLFYLGKYNDALTNTINVLEKVQPGFYSWLMAHFEAS